MPTTNVVIPNMVKGPASATDDTFVKYDGTTGKLLKDGVAGSDGGNGAADGGKVALFKSTGALEGRCTVSFGVKGTSVSGLGVDGRSEGIGVYGLGEADGVGVSGNSLGAGAGVSSSVSGTGPMFLGLNEDADGFQVDHDGALAWSGPGAATAVATTRTNLGLGALAVKSTVATADIDNDAVTFDKIQNINTSRLLGRTTAGSGNVEEVTVDGGLEFNGSALRRSALTGDVTANAGSGSTTIANSAVTNAKLADMEQGFMKGRGVAEGTGPPQDLQPNDIAAILDTATDPFARTSALPTLPTTAKWDMTIAVSDESTDLTTGTAKVTFRMPRAVTLTGVRASVNTAPVGSTIIVDINEGGSTILSTKLSIDASEKTSTTAATPAVISDTSLADDAEITIDIDQVGSTTAGRGLKVTLLGTIAV